MTCRNCSCSKCKPPRSVVDERGTMSSLDIERYFGWTAGRRRRIEGFPGSIDTDAWRRSDVEAWAREHGLPDPRDLFDAALRAGWSAAYARVRAIAGPMIRARAEDPAIARSIMATEVARPLHRIVAAITGRDRLVIRTRAGETLSEDVVSTTYSLELRDGVLVAVQADGEAHPLDAIIADALDHFVSQCRAAA